MVVNGRENGKYRKCSQWRDYPRKFNDFAATNKNKQTP
jgi:hypothetical protein